MKLETAVSAKMTPSFPVFMQSLQQIMPPSAVIHVGAGNGMSSMHQWRQWQVARAWLIDAQDSNLGWARELQRDNPQWQVVEATLAEKNGEAPFYHASNPAQNGLLAPERFHAIWPNLHTVKQQAHAVTSLDGLLSDAVVSEPGIWLLIDCLPTLAILRGAPHLLPRCSVLWLRSVLQPLPQLEQEQLLVELEAFLLPQGFHRRAVIEGNHPAMGEVIFVRDWQAFLAPKVAYLKKECASLQAANHAQAIHAAEQLAQLEQLEQLENDKTTLAVKLAEQEQAVAALEQQRLKMAGDLTSLEISHRQQAELLVQHQMRIEAQNKEQVQQTEQYGVLTKEKTVLSNANAELTQENHKLDEHSKALQIELNQLRQQQEQVQTQLQQQIDAHDIVRAELEQQLVALRSQADAQSNAAKMAQQQVGEFQQLTMQARQENATLLQQQQTLQEKLAQQDAASTVQTTQLAQLKNQQTRLDEQDKLLTALRTELAQEIKSHQAHIERIEKEKDQWTAQHAALQDDLKKSTVAYEEQHHLARERQIHVNQLIKSRDLMETAKIALEQKLKNKEANLLQCEQDLRQAGQTQQQLIEEMVRAEAQIDLIKDVLLREPGL